MLYCTALGLVFSGYSCKKDAVSPHVASKAILQLNIARNNTIIEKNSRLKSVATDDFKVEIYNSSNQQVMFFERLVDIPSSIELDAGEYYVVSYSDNRQNAAFDNPNYFGQSDRFTLTGGETKTVYVQCYLANAKVTVVYSDNVKTNFNDYQVVVSRGDDSLLFLKDDTRSGYFEPGKLEVRASLQYSSLNGDIHTKVINGTIQTAVARKHYELYVDASIEQGSSLINVTVIDTMEKETIMITENTSAVVKKMADVLQGEILITEVMANPDKIADELGEWFEIYNNSTSNININGLYLVAGTKNMSVTFDYTILPGQYAFLCKDAQGGAGAINYYGSALTLVNTNGSISLYNSNQPGATLLCGMTYSTSPTGASLSLDPNKLTFTGANDPSSWCTSRQVYSTGDKGTPGVQNEACN